MKTSIIYSVAVSVALISTLEISLEKSNFGKSRNRKEFKEIHLLDKKENQKAIIVLANNNNAKYDLVKNTVNLIVFEKPEMVFEVEPLVNTGIGASGKYSPDASAIIEDMDDDSTKELNINWINALAFMDEAIEIPQTVRKDGFDNQETAQELLVIEDTEDAQVQVLDYNWINTLSMFDEAITLPSVKSDSSSVNFSVVGEDAEVEAQPLDFNWIETLQMFDEPIVTPVHIDTDKNASVFNVLSDAIIESQD
jgi:hypothetical protein